MVNDGGSVAAALTELKTLLGSRVSDAAAVREHHSHGESYHPPAPPDIVCFPAGPDGAHKVSNRQSETARIVIFSTKNEPAVAVYPDSDKIGVWPPCCLVCLHF